MSYGQSIQDSYYTFGPDVPKDRVTLGLPVITTDHSLIHEGIAYNLSGTFGAAATLAAIGVRAPVDTAASKQIDMTDADSHLIYTFQTVGKIGNTWSVLHLDPDDGDQPLSVSVSPRIITVSLETDSDGVIVSTSEEVANAVNSHEEAGALVLCEEEGSGGVVNAVVSTALENGADSVFVHFKPLSIQSSESVATVQIIEDRAFTGDAVSPMWVPMNQNRTTSKTSEVTITSSAAATLATAVTGTKVLLQKTARGSAQGAGRFVASVGAAEEIVLKPGVQYIVSIVRPVSTAVDFELFWYEEGGA